MLGGITYSLSCSEPLGRRPDPRLPSSFQSDILSGSFIADLVSHGSMGISKVCSIGNKVDVDECELLEFLIKDPETAVISMYLEGIPKGRRFLRSLSGLRNPSFF